MSTTYTPTNTGSVPPGEFDVMEAWGGPVPELGSHLHEWYEKPTAATLFDHKPASVDVTKPHTFGLLWAANGKQRQGGSICSYVDNIRKGCADTTAASEAQDAFLILAMGVGCNFNYHDRSCLGSLSRADMYVSRVTVFGK